MSRLSFLTLAFLFSSPLMATDTLSGKVIATPEGQTLIVRDDKKVSHTIRLAWVEIPDKRQPYYKEARRFIQRLVNKTIFFEWDRVDDTCAARKVAPAKCPKIGRVMVGNTDVNLELVRRGLAWHDPRTVAEQSTTDREMYPHEEAKAVAASVGLWKQANPVQPWTYRELASKQPVKKKKKKKKRK